MTVNKAIDIILLNWDGPGPNSFKSCPSITEAWRTILGLYKKCHEKDSAWRYCKYTSKAGKFAWVRQNVIDKQILRARRKLN